MKKQLEMSRTVKRILSQVLSLVLAMVLVCPVVAPVSAATGYDANAAIAYAKKHWNDGNGLCAEFVSDCINAGGCPVWFYGCTTLVRMLEKSGYGTFYKLDVDSQGRISVPGNRDKLSVGDPVFYYCAKETDGCPYVHAVLYSGEDSSGYLKAYAHNRAKNNEVLYYSNCGYCGAKISTAYVYHMTENYTVTFDAEGGSVYPTSVTAPEGYSSWNMPIPTREGYSFMGWSDSPEPEGSGTYSGTVYTDSRDLDVSGDMTLYAHWSRNYCAEHTPQSYETIYINGYYRAACKTCRQYFDLGDLDTSAAGTYKVNKNDLALCSAPYQDSKFDTLDKGEKVTVVGSVKNAYGTLWYKLADGNWVNAQYLIADSCRHTQGSYVRREEAHPHYRYYRCADCGETYKSTKVTILDDCTQCNPAKECTSHVKGESLYCSADHPHYEYFKCANCGETFADYNSSRKMDGCSECRTWGDWSDWSTNAVSATSTRQVETRQVKVSDAYTEYRYGRYVSNGHDCWCRTYLASRPYSNGSISTEYSSWSTRRYSIYDTGWTCGECSGNHSGYYETDSQGREFWHEYRIGGKSYWWEESRTVPAQYRTEYRYRSCV